MERKKLYRAIHKAVRVSLSRLSAQAGSTDFGDAEAVVRLRAAADETFWLLDEHASTEDRFVMPLLRRCAPDVARKLDDAHVELEATNRALWAMLGVVAQAGAKAPHEGHAFLLQLSRFQAAHLAHMADEEELAQPALWRAHDDEALVKVHQQILASIPPRELPRVMALMLPAINPAERAEILSGVKAQAPAPVFEGLMRVAVSSLDAPSLARLERDLSLARAA